jgi:putative oxidoreductase
MHAIKAFLPLLGRLLMSSIFIYEGIVLLRDPGGFTKYFASVHVPAPEAAVWIAIVIQLAGGLAILLGFKARWAAAVLALFCLGTAFGVHLPAGDTANMIHFYKNLVMAGGFLYVVAYGAGRFSMDGPAA